MGVTNMLYETARDFCLIVAFLLFLRNTQWVYDISAEASRLCLESLRMGLPASAAGMVALDSMAAHWARPRTFPEGIVRAGSFLLAIMAFSAFLIPSTRDYVQYLDGMGNEPGAMVAILCLACLLVWRWLYFIHRRTIGWVTIGIALALSPAIRAWQGLVF